MLRLCKKLARSKTGLLVINLPLCLGILLSGLLAVTVPVLADGFDQSQQVSQTKTPPCHPKAPPQERSACGDYGELCIVCPSGIILDYTLQPFWLAGQAVTSTIHQSLTDQPLQPELHPPISIRFS